MDSKIVFSEEVADEFVPRVFEVEAQRGPAIELRFATEQIRLEQRHAATDVAADEVRVNDILRSRRPRRSGVPLPGCKSGKPTASRTPSSFAVA